MAPFRSRPKTLASSDLIDFHGLSDEHVNAALAHIGFASEADPDDAAAARELAKVHALIGIATAIRALDISVQYAYGLDAEDAAESDGQAINDERTE